MNSIDLSVKIGNLELNNPVMLASGTVGYGNEISEFTDLSRIGGIVTKSVSLKPRKGNPPNRIFETSSGMLNAIGLANVGLEEFIKTKIPFLKEMQSTLICWLHQMQKFQLMNPTEKKSVVKNSKET